MGYQVDFLPVGDSNGDAICIRYGTEANGYTIHVVDGGWSETSQVIIDHIEKYYGKGARIDHMVLSHADNDHAVGLPAVLEHFEVGALWMNRPWLYAAQVIDDFHKNYTVAGLVARMKELHEYLVELEKIAERKKVPIYPVFQGSQIGSFHVLAPSQQRYLKSIHDLDKTPDSYVTAAAKSTFGYITELARKAVEWVGEKWDVETLSENVSTNASNETCLVQMGYLDSARILLTADVGPIGLAEAADYAQPLGLLSPPSLVQVPHHGSRHNVTPTVLNRWLGDPLPDQTTKRGSAFCSVGKDADTYPRRSVSNAFLRRGYPVISTKGSAKSLSKDMPDRGWQSVEGAPFYDQVEG